MHKLGTLAQFELDNKAAKKAAGWTKQEITNGRIVVDGEVGVPDSIITNLLSRRQNPTGLDQYLWESASGDIKDTFNLLAVWNREIIKPIPPIYYIANNSGSYIYGKVESASCYRFGAFVTDIEIFDGKRAYNARIKELGIKIEKI